MAKQKVKKFAAGGIGMMAPKFPSDFKPPAPGQTYINPNIKPAGVTGTLPPRLQQATPTGGIRFPSDFTPPAPGQTYINPNIKPAGVTGTLPPRLQQATAPSPALVRGMARDQAGPRRRFKSGGSVRSASKRADGIAVKGKTRGKIC
jgi:hypothetical protein